MSLLTAKVDYALRALLDLAAQPSGHPTQSREIAARQEIPESYLNQLLVVLRRAGLVQSVRGASGGYVLGKEPRRISLAEVFQAMHGMDFLGAEEASPTALPTTYVIRSLGNRLNETLLRVLEETTLADLLTDVQRLDEAQSLMLGL